MADYDATKTYAVSGEELHGIAEAIRLKRDITDGIPVADMAMQIGLIDGGGGLEEINIDVTVRDFGSVVDYLNTHITPSVTGSTWLLRKDGAREMYYLLAVVYKDGQLDCMLRQRTSGVIEVISMDSGTGTAMWGVPATFYRVDLG